MIALLAASSLQSTLTGMAEPWNKLYSDSKLVDSIVVFMHLAPLVVAGGTAWVADRATMRAARGTPADRARQLTELGNTHRLVIGGLALSLISGVLLFASDVKTFFPSPFFWIKLGLVALLLLNGLVMTRTEASLHKGGDELALWGRLRTLAMLSAVLWLATTLAGVVLSNYA
jgi:hypothetical protein